MHCDFCDGSPVLFACEKCSAQFKILNEETLRRLAQGVQDYNDGKIVGREWRKPSLWRRIKCFLNR